MPETEKEDILESTKKRKRNKLIISFSIVFAIIIIFLFLGILAYKYFQSPEYELELGADIEEFLISEDDNYGYVKLKTGSNDESKNITKVKFIFSDVNGNKYVYETEKGLGNISVPYKKGILDFFKGPEFKGGYDYNVSVDEVSGLKSFENVKKVEVVFEYEKEDGEVVESPVLDTKKPTAPVKKSVGGSGGGGGGGGGGDGGGDTGGCTASLTCADYSGECGTELYNGCSNSLDCSGNCGSGEVCVNESCVDVCIPDCSGKQCGGDGCGGSCGSCGTGYYCDNGNCVEITENMIFVDGTLSEDCVKNYSIANRDCSGSDGDAYITLEESYSIADVGDIVLVREGNYTTSSYYSTPANSGAPGNPITFKNYPGEHIYFKGTWTASGSSCTGTPVSLSNKANLIFDGFEISNYCICISLGNSSNIILKNMILHDCIYGVSIRSNSSNISIENAEGYRNSRYNDGGCGVSTRDSSNILVKNFYSHDNDDLLGPDGDGDGFCTSSGENITFINSTASNNSEDGFDLTGLNVKLINSKAYNSGANGVKTWRRGTPPQPAYFTIINLISFNNGESGISASNGPDVSIYNSIFYNNGAEGIRFINSPKIAEAIVYNNIIMGNGFFTPVDNTCCYPSFVVGTNWSVTADYNLYYNNWNNITYSGEGSNSLLEIDPKFFSTGASDFHLKEGSPAIDNGTSLSLIFNYDIEGRTRPQGAGWDIGAYEFEEVVENTCYDCELFWGAGCNYDVCKSDFGECYYDADLNGEDCVEFGEFCNERVGSCSDYWIDECGADACGLGCEVSGSSCVEIGTSVCGDGVCNAGEDCSADGVGCPDNTCYEPSCSNGCGEILVGLRQNDEGCLLPEFCDGAGSCVECIDETDCSEGKYCNNGNCVDVGSSWPTFKQNNAHTGYSQSTAPDTNNTLWTYFTGATYNSVGSMRLSSPAVVDGVVYIGQSLTDGLNSVFAINATTGSLIWEYGSGGAVASSPAVVGNIVYFGTGTGDNSVYALNKSNGNLVWRYATGDRVLSSPAVENNIVYINSFDGYLYALNATSNNLDGELIWRTIIGNTPHTSPALDNNVVYVGSGINYGPAQNITALNALNGNIIWTYPVPSGIGSSPTISNGILYEGSDSEQIYAINTTGGMLIWNYSIGGNFATPSVAFGRVYMINDDAVYMEDKSRYLYVFDAMTGSLMWKYNITKKDSSYPTNNPASSPLVSSDGKVCFGIDGCDVGSGDCTEISGEVICLNATVNNPQIIWSYNLGPGVVVDSSPALWDGNLYIAARDGNLYAFGSQELSSINPLTRVWNWLKGLPPFNH